MTKQERAPKADWSEAMRDARRERIIDAAARVFSELGFDRASVRKIATEAGCTTGAIYPLFASKEEIYAELLSRSLRDLQDRWRASDSEAATPEERVRARAFAALDFYLERPTDFTLSFYLSAGLGRKGMGKDLDAELNERLAELDAMQQEVLAECIGPEAAARESSAVFAFVTGLLVMQLRGRFHVFDGDPHTLLARYLDTLLGPPSSTQE